ncbi:Inosine-uridine preferring nucleoside hydrolase, partial [Trichostrongylus colubriformis]
MSEFSSAEFNFGADPEAAKIVLEEMNTRIILVPWENAYLNGAQHEQLVDFESHLKIDTPLAGFLALATNVGHGIMAKHGRQYVYCDEIAVAVAIDEKTIATKTMDLRLGVELSGEMT